MEELGWQRRNSGGGYIAAAAFGRGEAAVALGSGQRSGGRAGEAGHDVKVAGKASWRWRSSGGRRGLPKEAREGRKGCGGGQRAVGGAQKGGGGQRTGRCPQRSMASGDVNLERWHASNNSAKSATVDGALGGGGAIPGGLSGGLGRDLAGLG